MDGPLEEYQRMVESMLNVRFDRLASALEALTLSQETHESGVVNPFWFRISVDGELSKSCTPMTLEQQTTTGAAETSHDAREDANAERSSWIPLPGARFRYTVTLAIVVVVVGYIVLRFIIA